MAPARLCPHCGSASPLDGAERLWPADWRCPACAAAVASADGVTMFAPELADTVTGMDPAGLGMLRAAEDRHFWFRARNALLAGLLRRHCPQARSFLEIGCGNGAVLARLAETQPWDRLAGSELHPSGLRRARERLGGRAEFFQMDARRIPFAEAFDVAGAFDVLEHIPEDEAVLAGLHRALAPGGGLLLSVPQHPWLWSEVDDVAHHVRRYRRGELERKVARAGFEVVRSTSFTALLLPAMAASRLLRRRRPQSVAEVGASEFAIGEAANRTLYAVTRAEVALTLAGLSWPAGGSRVVVARKR